MLGNYPHLSTAAILARLAESRTALTLAVASNLPEWAESYRRRIDSLERMLMRAQVRVQWDAGERQ